MGKHVATTNNRTLAQFIVSARNEREAESWGPDVIASAGRHVEQYQCGAYILVGGVQHGCEIPIDEHPGLQHGHHLYGTWDNAVWNLDAYRKRFVR